MENNQLKEWCESNYLDNNLTKYLLNLNSDLKQLNSNDLGVFISWNNTELKLSLFKLENDFKIIIKNYETLIIEDSIFDEILKEMLSFNLKPEMIIYK